MPFPSTRTCPRCSTRRPSSRRPPRNNARSEPRETRITLDQAAISKSLENFTDLLSQVRVRPHYKGGQADGLLLSQVKPNTVFTRLGLRNGDVIQSVDGEEIQSPDDILDFYEELKSGSSVSLQIMRREKKKRSFFKQLRIIIYNVKQIAISVSD